MLKSKHRAKQKREAFITTTEEIIKILRQKKEYFKEKYGVKKIVIFGSRARGICISTPKMINKPHLKESVEEDIMSIN